MSEERHYGPNHVPFPHCPPSFCLCHSRSKQGISTATTARLCFSSFLHNAWYPSASDSFDSLRDFLRSYRFNITPLIQISKVKFMARAENLPAAWLLFPSFASISRLTAAEKFARGLLLSCTIVSSACNTRSKSQRPTLGSSPASCTTGPPFGNGAHSW